ncbi:MAG: hypothetical protein KatS3mg111_0249 [Pirellulaceae bacterium]|nr:MAG: hypothetical protein KatS3mg111_0249 [Pirellulaceae bacterium]
MAPSSHQQESNTRHDGRRRSRRKRKSKVLTRLSDSLGRPFKRLRAWWAHWRFGKILNKQLAKIGSSCRAIFRFRGTDYATAQHDGQVVVRTWPSAATIANPVWWLIWMATAAWRWLLSRPYLPMLAALPALVAVLGLLAISFSGARVSAGTEAIRYRRILADALANGQMDRARLAADALMWLNPESSEHAFQRALVEFEAGNLEAAKQMMAELATADRSLPAAMWLVQQVGDGTNVASWTDEQKKEAYRWLTIAMKNAPDDPRPRQLLGRILNLAGDYRAAYATLQPIADIDADTAYLVTFLEKQLGLIEQAKKRGQKLERLLRERIQANPHDFEARRQYVAMLFLLEREPDAVKVINDGLLVATDPQEVQALKSYLTEAIVLQAQRKMARDDSPQALITGLELLRQAMAIDPNNPLLIEAISTACLRAANSENEELKTLREAIVQGVAPDAAHFILGTIALNQGSVDQALQHLEIAAKNNPNLPGVLNNLAHAISHSDMPDYDRALRLAEAAVRMLPNHPYLRETRGQIYLHVGRYADAIADLEIALQVPELRADVRPSLAKAYEALGEHELARRQRELLELGQ